MYEFPTPRSRKRSRLIKSFNLRVRQKLGIVEEFNDLIENSMYDTHKGIYIPLFLHFNLIKFVPNKLGEIYLRMKRLPMNL